MEYTKGEWKVYIGKCIRVESESKCICLLHDCEDEDLVNAQLIASSPKLYEALKYIIRELDKANIIKANSVFMLKPQKAIAEAEGGLKDEGENTKT